VCCRVDTQVQPAASANDRLAKKVARLPPARMKKNSFVVIRFTRIGTEFAILFIT
jgi:hypothetical protein